MAEQTGISWTDCTFNPWIGCTKVSPGCAHCYAETLVHGRMGRGGTWGDDGRRERTSQANWRKPVAWDRESAAQGRVRFGGRSDERIRVFCASLADVFEPRPELDQWRHELFDLIAATPHLDWQLLTKRPEDARDWLRARYWPFGGMPALAHVPESHGCPPDAPAGVYPPNLWLGVSIESSRFTWRADVLRQIPVAVRFVSAEPLLGSLFAGGHGAGGDPRTGPVVPDETPSREGPLSGQARLVAPLNLDGIDWVIVGGESGGRNARPMHPEWAREIRDAVRARGPYGDEREETVGRIARAFAVDVAAAFGRPALHMKQWGSWTPDLYGRDPNAVWVSPDGRSRSSLAADAHDDFPNGSMRMRYAGAAPTAGGKLLDGVDWCEFPESPATAAQLTLA